jgi:predicted ArsR family transcriptional regulator
MPDPTVSAAGMRVMELLVGRPPQTVADLIVATGVTRTAVTEQLNELMAAGFVKRGTERLAGRGRPRHVYAATQASLISLFANHHHLVVPAIWKAIEEVGGQTLTGKILGRVSRQLAQHYKRRITVRDPRKRLRRFAQLLREEGALVEVAEEDGRVLMRKRSCPFISMLDEKRSVCCVDEAMTAEVVGRPVRRTSYRHEGAPCCTFEVDRGA